jgi:general secretion pathway protein K
MRNRPAQSGIALVLVLWVLSLLTVMALGLTMTQRGEQALARNQLDGARFRALAEGAIHLAMLNLMSDPIDAVPTEDLWRPDGTPHRLSLGGEEIEIRIFNEASRIDLNSMSREQLITLFELAGAPAGQLDALADAVVDWRDEDGFAGLNGAEDDAYQAEGYDYGAADQPFESLEELLQVRGMTRELFWAVAEDLRVGAANAGGLSAGPVFGGSHPRQRALSFDSEFASALALAVMQNLTLEEANLLVAERDQPRVPGAEAPRKVDRGGPEYRIRAIMQRGHFIYHALDVVVRIAPRGTPPFEILLRREDLGQKTSRKER